jgi:hypothetical protein
VASKRDRRADSMSMGCPVTCESVRRTVLATVAVQVRSVCKTPVVPAGGDGVRDFEALGGSEGPPVPRFRGYLREVPERVSKPRAYLPYALYCVLL